MKMVRSDLASSGVMFTLDTESGFRDVVFITGSYGLGENIVQGSVDPDEFYVHKPGLASGHRAVLRRLLGAKALRMVLSEGGSGATTRNERDPGGGPGPLLPRRRRRARARRLRRADRAPLRAPDGHRMGEGRHRRQALHRPGPTRDGRVPAARPSMLETYVLDRRGEVVIEGRSVGERIAVRSGPGDPGGRQLAQFRPGEVLVADTTTPDWEPVMKTAAAIVTDRGGRTCHAAIIARELGIPAVVGTGDATTAVGDGEPVTVSCAEGAAGFVYRGELGFRGRPSGGGPHPSGHPDHGQPGQPQPRLLHVLPPVRRRRTGPDGVHHQRVDPGSSAGAPAPRTGSATPPPGTSWRC